MADASIFDRHMAPVENNGTNYIWHEIPCKNIEVRGLGFFEKEKKWCRLPLNIVEQMLNVRKAVSELAFHMAGASLNFGTDSTEVWIKATLDSAPYMSHMTAAAQCGFDCYVKIDGKWSFAGVTKFDVHASEICCRIAKKTADISEVCINLPLYIGVKSVSVGVIEGCEIYKPSPLSQKKSIAFYGTSITQGGCASRPGMAYPSLLGRALDVPVYNMGFSGNGVGNIALAKSLCQLPNLGLLVVDIVPNAGPENLLEQNLPEFLNEIHKISPDLPILVLSGTNQARCVWDKEYNKIYKGFAEFEERLVEKMQLSGNKNIFFANACELVGSEIGLECTVDGVHLTDLGFYKLAEGLQPILQKIL